MTIDDIIHHVAALGGVLVLRPEPGDGSPEISWGDVFFYYAPTGEVPRTQPFATIVTKDYPDEPGIGPGPARGIPAQHRCAGLGVSTVDGHTANQSQYARRLVPAPGVRPSRVDLGGRPGRAHLRGGEGPAQGISRRRRAALPAPPPRVTTPASSAPGELDLTMDELREITRYVAECAAFVQDVFQQAHPEDPRVGAALDAARAFASGGPRNRRLRTTSVDAHRAAKDATGETARLAARAAGDAAAAAYLHPIARAHQVGHILRAAACAARIAELTAADDPTAAARAIEDATARATPALIDVLSRYATPPAGRNRVEQLMSALDTALRAHPDRNPA